MMCYWTATTDTNGVPGNDQSRRQLPALEFIRGRFDPVENLIHESRLDSSSDDLFRSRLLFKIQTQDWVEFVVGWKGLIIKLAWSQFRRRAFLDDRLRNHFIVAVRSEERRVGKECRSRW